MANVTNPAIMTSRGMTLSGIGVGGAEAGTLTFMVGGTEEEFKNARTYLAAMGKNIVHCGAVGTGQVI